MTTPDAGREPGAQESVPTRNERAFAELFEQLRRAVSDSGSTPQAIAEVLGVTPDNLCRALAGTVDLSLADLAMLLDAMGAEISFHVALASGNGS